MSDNPGLEQDVPENPAEPEDRAATEARGGEVVDWLSVKPGVALPDYDGD